MVHILWRVGVVIRVELNFVEHRERQNGMKQSLIRDCQ
jgi:hypothetical protein